MPLWARGKIGILRGVEFHGYNPARNSLFIKDFRIFCVFVWRKDFRCLLTPICLLILRILRTTFLTTNSPKRMIPWRGLLIRTEDD